MSTVTENHDKTVQINTGRSNLLATAQVTCEFISSALV